MDRLADIIPRQKEYLKGSPTLFFSRFRGPIDLRSHEYIQKSIPVYNFMDTGLEKRGWRIAPQPAQNVRLRLALEDVAECKLH